jgi:hypothetical protein
MCKTEILQKVINLLDRNTKTNPTPDSIFLVDKSLPDGIMVITDHETNESFELTCEIKDDKLIINDCKQIETSNNNNL